ncbi:MAG: ABC transporter permease subunit [Caldisericaceae bacterium]|jgi:ABC-type transport system involved in multi-copper enzyme maturation permease subunit|nr:ABC transporter permease subunit [Caldisericaceae bacterium]
MKAILKKEFRENIMKFIVETALLSGISATLIPLGFKLLVDIEKENPLISSRYGPLLAQLRDLNVFVRSQWFGKNLLELAILFAVINGIGIVAGEYERKTAIFLFSRPVSRKSVFFGKIVVAILYTLIPIIISTFFILPSVKTVPQSLDMPIFFKLLIQALFASTLTVVIAGIASIIVNDRVKGGLIILSCIVGDIILASVLKWNFINYSLLFTGDFVKTLLISSVGTVLALGLSFHLIEKKEF